MSRQFDALILGAGPAGMSAAIRARALGLEVAVVDEQPAPGGQIWRDIERSTAHGRSAALGSDYAAGAEVVAAFRSSGATYLAETTVWQVEPGYRVYIRRGNEMSILSAKTLLIATGAMERPVPFPGWTLPGVMTVGAAQILLKSAGQVPDVPVWIAGNGPLMLLYVNQLLDAGGQVAGILDTAVRANRWAAVFHLASALASWDELVKGIRWVSRLRGIPVVRGVRDIEAVGESKLEAVRYRTENDIDGAVTTGILLVHEGVIPDIHLSLALDCRHDWNEVQQCFVPTLDEWGQTSMGGVFVAGDGGGIGGAGAAGAAGEIAAYGMARVLGRLTGTAAGAGAAAPRRLRARALAIRPLLDTLHCARRQVTAPADKTVVCRCEDITAGTIRAAAKAGARDPNQVKAITRCGMGPCLGRQCGAIASRIIAETLGRSMVETGLSRVRPPLRPITMAQLAALGDSKT